MSYVNSRKYGSSIQLYTKKNGDISYYITYKDEYNKLKRIILDQIAQIYFENKNSTAKRISKYELHIKPVFGKKGINNITRDEILKFRDQLIKNGKSLQTAKGVIQLISTIYNYNIKEKSLKTFNPAVGIKWDKQYKIDNTREKYLTLAEIKKLLKEVSDNSTLIHRTISSNWWKTRNYFTYSKKTYRFRKWYYFIKKFKNK